MSPISVSIDAGGTFLDITAVDFGTGRVRILKLPRRKDDQASEVEDGIATVASDLADGTADVRRVVVGTTVVTNALLEGRLTRVGLVTTEGFGDTLALGRMFRASSYDLEARRPAPIVPESRTFEVKERVDAQGHVIIPLQEESIHNLIDDMAAVDIESICVCLLHSYANPQHERAVAAALDGALGCPITMSSDLLPVFREFERMTTTAVNAAAIPVFGRFANEVGTSDGAKRSIFVFTSSGGCIPLQEARRRPAETVLSGPAGGVIGAARLARGFGHQDVITLDVGGTSTDVALLRRGAPLYTNERAVGGHPVALPAIEIQTIGAGGGSKATLDASGLLQVGPESAGSVPGPVCYGRGGTTPTVTDCHVALGFIGEATMLGGSFALSQNAAIDAITQILARPLELSWVRAAHGVIALATTNMVRAVRRISVERGYDPRGAVLVPFGGAGPLHAVDVARELEMPRILVPNAPGVFSALGMLSGDIRYGRQWTWFHDLATLTPGLIHEELDRIEASLQAASASWGVDSSPPRFERGADLRYRGQGYTLTVDLPSDDVEPALLASVFHEMHQERYGYYDLDGVIELVNLRSTLVLDSPQFSGRMEIADPVRPLSLSHEAPLADSRTILLDDETEELQPVYQRSALRDGEAIEGPALIEQYDSLVRLGPSDIATMRDQVLEIAVALGG